MVPGSTLRYGSNFNMEISSPRLSSKAPIEAEATPFPKELTTPPVIKIYLVLCAMGSQFFRVLPDWQERSFVQSEQNASRLSKSLTNRWFAGL